MGDYDDSKETIYETVLRFFSKMMGEDSQIKVNVDGENRSEMTIEILNMVEVTDGKWESAGRMNFHLTQLPGCCGVLVSHNTSISGSFKNKKFSYKLMELKKQLAKDWKYGLLLATIVDTNVVEKHILEKTGWIGLGKPFRNPNTNNIILTYAYHIPSDAKSKI